MKIIRQSSEQIVLKESRIKEIVYSIFTLLLIFLASEINSNIFSTYQVTGIAVPFIQILGLAIGILVLLFSCYIRVELNKATGQITYQKKFLITTKTQQYPLTDVIRIETRRRWQFQMRNQRLMTQSVLLFKDGTELPLDHEMGSSDLRNSSGVLMGASGAETTSANIVASFLGVPFQEVAPPGTLTTEPPETTPMGVRIALGILLVAIITGLVALAYFDVFKQ